ncbi:hypothetical protein JB92DRAFT_2869116 [Gautieria morchelliformis]|nr:hypothetical protein JB92DRAFT_2869116 [Gautieria morchelliformis]
MRTLEQMKERATVRHKNTGKWAKALKGMGKLSILERGEVLRGKIQGDNGSDDDDDDDDTDRGVEDITGRPSLRGIAVFGRR